MRVLDQETMRRVFAITDEMGLSREAVTVPLAMAGEGKVGRTRTGRFEITLPEADDLGPFLAALPGRLQELGA